MQGLKAEVGATLALEASLARPPWLLRQQRRGSALSCREPMRISAACIIISRISRRLLGYECFLVFFSYFARIDVGIYILREDATHAGGIRCFFFLLV